MLLGTIWLVPTAAQQEKQPIIPQEYSNKAPLAFSDARSR